MDTKSFLGLNVLDISEAEFVCGISIPKSTDIVQISSPSIELVTQAREKNFLFKPFRLLWIMEIPVTTDEYFAQLSSKQRKNIKRSIRSFQSASLTLRFEEHLNSQSYRVWLELYRKVIGGMNIGNVVATESFFDKKKDSLVGIFLQDSQNNLCGGTIAQLHSDDMFVCKFGVIHPNYRHLDLTRYLDFEAMQLARRLGCSIFSLGTDTNLYGYHLSVGLYLYKKTFGVHPVPRQVIDPNSIDVLQKITNFKKFSEQCFILSYGGDDKFVGNLFCKKIPDKTTLEMYTAPFLEKLRIIQVESDESSMFELEETIEA